MGSRSVLINLLGDGGGASHALRGVGDDADRAARRVDGLDESNRRASEGGNIFTRSMEQMAPAAGRAAASIGLVAAQAGAAIPAAAGLAATVIQIAPAAAVAATGIAAVGLAAGALKIGMAGVGDAVKQAFAADGDPAKLAAAMKNLSPNARAFVTELIKLKPALDAIKTTVQDSLFEGLDKQFATTARATLPALRAGLTGAASALNAMASNALGTVRSLAKTGTLGDLFGGATKGLGNLTQVPAQLIRGFVQLGAAAAPVFVKMTAAIGSLVTKASNAFSGAFTSGALTGAINTAVGLLKQLGQVAVNVFKIVSNIFGVAQASGGGFVGTLQKITAALAGVTANPAFQAGLRAIFETMSQLATTAAPLLAQALLAIAPVFAALGPPIQTVIQALGQALQPVIAALGPVLVAVAQAFGALIVALAPLLPVIGQIIAAVLPVLIPVFQLLAAIFTALTPVITTVANALTTYLVPVINTVVGVVTTVVNWIKSAAEQAFPALASAVTSAGGPLAGLKGALVDLWNAIQPLIAAIGNLIATGFKAIQPYLPAIGDALKTLAGIFIGVLKLSIEGVTLAVQLVTTAITGLTRYLNGDASASLRTFGQQLDAVNAGIIASFQSLPARTTPVINQWTNGIVAAAKAMTIAVGQAVLGIRDAADIAFVALINMTKKMVSTLIAGGPPLRAAGAMLGKALLAGLNIVAPELVWAAKNWIKGVTGILRAAGPAMVAIGRSIITGLLAGVNSAAGGLFSRLSSIAGSVAKIFSGVLDSHSPSRVMIGIGHDVMDGLDIGLTENAQKVYGTVGKIASKLGDLVDAGAKKALEDAHGTIDGITRDMVKGLRGTADQIDAATKKIAAAIRSSFRAGAIDAGQRDGLLDYLANTNKKLKELTKERQAVLDKIKEVQDYAKQLTQSVLNYAAITQIKGDDGAAPNGGQLVAGLQARLATIREFGANIKKLAGAGLSKALLGQILDAGIDGGAAIAAELANGPSSIITALNTAQTQITKIAKGIGLDGADALFGSGKAMGDAFLKGLKSLEKALVDSMEELVAKLLKALGGGVDKAKGKLAELAETSKQAAQLAELVVTSAAKAAAYQPPQPKAPGPAPVAPQVPYIPAPKTGGGQKAVTVNVGGVTVKDKPDADMLMNLVEYRVRSAVF